MEKGDENTLSKRYLIIGLDGATPEILEPMLEKGELHNIKKLIDQGVYSHMHSTMPPLSPVAWTSMTTGVNPAKHGITGFDRRREDSYITEVFNSGSRRVKSIWTILSEFGKKVGVINVPMTYPPDKVNGIMISGLGAPGEKSSFTFPEELKRELIEKIGGFRGSRGVRFRRNTIDAYISNLYEILENHFKTAVYCMSKDNYDFFMVVFMALDEASHFLWNLTDEKHPSYRKDAAEKFGNPIRNLYKALDIKVGELIHAFGDDATVIVVSDHGFGPLRKTVSINLLFEKLGYLRFHHRSRSIFSRINYFLVKVKGYLRKRKGNVFRLFGFGKRREARGGVSPDLQFLEPVDWLRTTAYSMDDCGSIFINLKGREPMGIVERGQPLEDLKADIKKKLLELKDPENNHTMVKDVIFKENIYQGNSIHQVPDVFIVWEKGYGAVSDRARIKRRLMNREGNFFVQHNWSGHHIMDGIFIINGSHIKNGIMLEGIKIYDVFPTILYSMGLPLPDKLDGRIIKECFSRDIQEKYSQSINVISPDDKNTKEISKEEQERIMEQLKSLGYLE